MAAAAAARVGGCRVSLCLAAAGVMKTLAVASFTLAWTHSVEKTAWQEDWLVTPGGLALVQARVKGAGAGMEPPPEARLIAGWFQWTPRREPVPEVILGNSGAAGDWQICADGKCLTLSNILERDIGVEPTMMSACDK